MCNNITNIVLFYAATDNVAFARPSMRANQEVDPDSETQDSSPQAQGFLQRIMGIIRGILNSGRAFLSGKSQRVIEYVTTILGNLAGGNMSGNLRSRNIDNAEKELMKVAKETERYTAGRK